MSAVLTSETAKSQTQVENMSDAMVASPGPETGRSQLEQNEQCSTPETEICTQPAVNFSPLYSPVPPDSKTISSKHYTTIFGLHERVSQLNKALQEQQEDRAAIRSLLTEARQACDHHVQHVSQDFATSQSLLQAMLSKSKKKEQKKVLKQFDEELSSANRELEQARILKRHVEAKLRLLEEEEEKERKGDAGDLDELQIVLGEGEGGGYRRPTSNRFCRDLMLCLLISLLVMLMLGLLMSCDGVRRKIL